MRDLRAWLSGLLSSERRKETRATQLASGSEKLVNAYGAVMERYPLGYVDASVLPASKEALKLAIKIAWKLSDENFRGVLGAGFVDLYRFQEGVGPKPITGLPEDLSLDDLKFRDSKEAMRQVETATKQFLLWSTRSEAEMRSLLAEFTAFEEAERSKR